MRTPINVVSASTFDADVRGAERPVLVDFYADWCGPCKAIAPTLEEIAGEFDGRVDVVKVNVDQSGELAAEFGVRGIPTLMVFKSGSPVDTVVGLVSKDKLARTIEAHI